MYGARAPSWRRRRDVVDQPGDRLWPITDLRAAFEHLDAIEALDRRVVIGRIVAIGRVRQWNAIFEEEHLIRPGRIQATYTDVRPQAEPLFVSDIEAGDLAQRLVRRHHICLIERVAIDHVN